MLQPYGPPKPPENQYDDTTLQCGSGGVSLMRRNRSVSIKDQLQQLSVQEEVVLVNDSIQRHVMDLQLQEAKRRTEEQSLVLDMRTQQLLNYTHEHVSQTRSESERRMNEQMIEDTEPAARHPSSYSCGALAATRRGRKSAGAPGLRNPRHGECYRDPGASRPADAAQRIGEQARKYKVVDASLFTNSDGITQQGGGDQSSRCHGAYREQQFQQRDADMAKIISAQIRAERRKGQRKKDERIQACVEDAARAVEIRVDAKLVELKNDQEQRCRDLQFGMEKRLQHVQSQASPAPQQSSESILQKVETIIDARIKAEVENLRASQEHSIEAAVEKTLQDQRLPTKTTVACNREGDTKENSDAHSPPRRTAQAKAFRGGARTRKSSTRPVRVRKPAPKAAAKLSRLDQVRADVIIGTVARAAERASALERSIRTNSSEQQRT